MIAAFWLLVGLLAGYAAREILHRVEAAGWRKERESLLNRIQARNLGEALQADMVQRPPQVFSRGPAGRAGAVARREGVSVESLKPPIPNCDVAP